MTTSHAAKKIEPYTDQWYESPLNLPEQRHGKMAVRHRIIPTGEEVSIVSAREALLRGKRPVRGTTQRPICVHELVEYAAARGRKKDKLHRLWMTDLPEELNQIAEMMYQVRPMGRVLVGGLGLGIVAQTVAAMPDVEEVTVVERSADVVAMIEDSLPADVYVQTSDLLTFLRTTERPAFDYYLLDTWGETNEGVWWDDVLPLRRVIRQRWGRRPVIHCWAEDVMVAQVVPALTMGKPHWYYKYLPAMTRRQAEMFVRDVGLRSWERKYGHAVDRALADAAEED